MRVIVIGGGAAGLHAAATAAKGGHSVLLLEKNEKTGKKLYITGKGRCNLTNDCDRDGFFANVARNPKFLYSAYAAFTPQDMMALLESLGVPLKVERGGRVFPASDKSSDILRALQRHAEESGAEIRLHTAVSGIDAREGRVSGVRLAGGEILPAEAVILATGGASYPATGSTGDGYGFAEALGHTVLPPKPALVPLETEERWPGELAGLTLKNVTLTAEQKGKRVYSELGEMLFAHFGVTGPLVLSASSYLADGPEGAKLYLDLKPGLTMEQLERRLQRDIDGNRQKSLKNALFGLLPGRLLPVALAEANLSPEASAGAFSKGDRQALANALKALPLTVRKARPLTEAIITRGGVSTKEVRPNTMESKLIRGLYFAGEILDADALTGGFNLQIAWFTAALAGQLL